MRIIYIMLKTPRIYYGKLMLKASTPDACTV